MVFVFLSLTTVFILNLIIFKVKKNNVNNIIVFLCTCLIIYFISFPKEFINSTLFGAKIFFKAVFPSLFPFLLICNILICYDGIEIYAKLFGRILCRPLRLPVQCSLTIIISSLCGYPLGAKYCCEIYEQNLISKAECQRLLNIASNASPIFVVGSVGTAMLGFGKIGYILLISNYISCFAMSYVLKPVISYKTNSKVSETGPLKNGEVNIGKALKDSIDNALKTTLSVGGYIVFFSVIIDIINQNQYLNYFLAYVTNGFLDKDVVKSFLLGFVELTKGCQLISTLDISLYSKTIITSFLIGFSGISIISQVYSFTSKYPEISMKKYIKNKFLQGVICALITAIIFRFFNVEALGTVFNHGFNYSTNLTLLMVLLSIPLIVRSIRKLLHIS